MKKVCFVSSSGGHFEQLMMLEPLMKKYNGFIVTEKTNYRNKEKHKTYYLKQVNRKESLFIPIFIYDFFYSFLIFIIERPDFVISTGALASIPLCLICKFFRKKLVFIESFAKINSPTLTGKLLYKYADQFYVQWEPMLEIYPNAIYLGGIY